MLDEKLKIEGCMIDAEALAEKEDLEQFNELQRKAAEKAAAAAGSSGINRSGAVSQKSK